MNHRLFQTGIIFSTLIVYWMSPLSIFGFDEKLLAHAQSRSSASAPTPHFSDYQEQLSNREVESVHVKFWRKHRSYPHLDKALRLIREGHSNEALEVYDHYLKADPNHYLMRWNRLTLLSKITGSKNVIDAATDFLYRVPDFGPALMIRGFAYYKIGSYEEAEEDFESARRYKSLLASDRKKVLAQLYALAYQRNDFNRSLELARQLIKTYPEKAIYRENYAQALFQLGKLPESEKQWQKVQALSSDKSTLRRATLSRMIILIQTGQYAWGDRILHNVERQDLFNPLDAAPVHHLEYLRLKATLSEKRGRMKMAETSLEDALYFLTDHPHVIPGGDLAGEYQKIGDTAFEANFMALALQAYTGSLTDCDDPRVRLKASETAWQLKQYHRTAGLLHPLVFGDNASDSPLSAKIAGRLCMTYGKQGLHEKASACFDKLLPTYSQDTDLVAKAAQAAGRAGRVQRQIDLLKQCYDLKPSPEKALSIGYLYTEMEQHKSANNWFQAAYQSSPSAESGLAYVNGLLAGRNIENALDVLDDIFQINALSPDQMEKAYGALGTAYMQQNQYEKAVDTWHKALEVSANPVWNIQRVEALRKSNRLKRAEVLFSTIPVALLPADDQLAWYDEAGELFRRTGRLDESLAALQEAAAMDSTYQRQLSLSMLLLEMDRLPEAEKSVNQALVHKPDGIVAQRHKAYVLAAKGDNLEAVDHMERINKEMPGDYETLHSLGILYLKLGRCDASMEAFTGAIDAIKMDQHGETVIPANRLQDLKNTQHQIAELSRRFHYSISQSVNIGQNEGRTHGVHLNDNGFSQAYGAAEVAYRPPFMGYKTSQIHEIYANALWTQNNGLSSEDDTSTQGRLGLRIKPIADANLLLSLESVFPFDGEQDPNVLLRLSHSYSRKLWQNRRDHHPLFGPNLYLHTYAEAGKAFLNEAEAFGNFQTRIGRSMDINGKLFLSPFFYFLANGYKNNIDSDAHGQAGVGMAVDLFSGYHRYKGYRGHTELLVRVGLDFDRDGENRDVNGLVGLRVAFF